MTERDDRELEQYLKGDSALSRRYREASAERAPPALDDSVLAQARAELRRKRGPNPWLASLALAASVVLAVNLGWHVQRSAPPPGEAPAAPMHDELARAPAAPAPAPAERPAAEADLRASKAEAVAARQARAEAQRLEEKEARADALARRKAAPQAEAPAAAGLAGASADAAAPPPAAALAATPAPALTEPQKIDRLIAFVGGLQGAVFIRNGDEHQAAEASQHLQMKREKAGRRVQTAEDFIRLCASHSYLTKEAYLIRFPDGRTRTAEDVLREELARLEGR